MQTAAIPGYRLSKAKFSTRVLTSVALLCLFFGLCSAALLTIIRTGLSANSVSSYYLGNESADLSDLDNLLAIKQKKTFTELAEVTHIHIFSGSLMLFLLCHLLSVCRVSERTRIFWYLSSFSTLLLTFAVPWLVVYLSSFFAYFFAPAVIGLLISITALFYIPLREMWFFSNES